MSAEQCQGSRRNDRLQNQKKDFWGIGNFYRYRLQILANLSGKHFGWNGMAFRGYGALAEVVPHSAGADVGAHQGEKCDTIIEVHLLRENALRVKCG